MTTAAWCLITLLVSGGHNDAVPSGNTAPPCVITTAIPTVPALKPHAMRATAYTDRYAWLSATAKPDTLKKRFPPPTGFNRVPVTRDSFAEWLRHLPMKPRNSPVYSCHGGIIMAGRNRTLGGVVDMDTGPENLQQCADSLIRLRAEWLWGTGQADAVTFSFTSGHQSSWKKWRKGYRPRVIGNHVTFVRRKKKNASHANFRRYLTNLFRWAGTLSLPRDSTPVPARDLAMGDFFLKSGSPGHTFIILDMVKSSNGTKMVMFAEGYMPAQDFHVLRTTNGTVWWPIDTKNLVLPLPHWHAFWSKFPWPKARRFK